MTTTAPPRAGGRWLALAALGMPGTALGLTLTEFLDWRWSLYLNVPLAVVAGLGAWFAVPATAGHRETKLDWTSAALSCGGVVVFVHALSEAATSGWNSLTVWGFLAPAVALLAAALAFLPTLGANLFASTQLSGRGSWRGSARVHCSPAGSSSSYATVLLPMQPLLSLGAGLCTPGVLNVATRDVGAGAASAFVTTSQQVGASPGTATLNTIATAAAAGLTTSAAIVHGYPTAEAWAAGIVGATALALLPHGTR